MHFPAVTGRDLTFTVTGVRLETTKDYSSQAPISLPLGIAELGIPGTQVAPPADVDARVRAAPTSSPWTAAPCSVAVTGSTTAALAGDGLTVTPCGPDANRHHPRSRDVTWSWPRPGANTGLDVDQLALDSAPGAAPPPPRPRWHASSPPPRRGRRRRCG